jgi:hypothetical protein
MAAIPKIDDDLIVSTLIEWQPKIFDNITNNNPLLRRLRKGGHIKHVSGGNCLEVDVMYKQNTNGRWFKDDDTFITNRIQTTQALYFDWYYYNSNMVIWGTEWAKNKGSKTRKFNLLETRKDNLMKSAQNDFGGLLWTEAANPALSADLLADVAAGPVMFGVPTMVADDPTNTIGGINRGDTTAGVDNSWWKNQAKVLTNAAEGKATVADMAQMVMRLTRGSERPTVIFMSMDMYTIYMQFCEDKKHITTNDTADGTFKGLTFQGIEVLYDPNIKPGHIYFLNENYIKLCVHPDLDFKLDVSKKPLNQYMEVYPMYFMGGFTLSNSALQGVLYTEANKYSAYNSGALTQYPLGPGPSDTRTPYNYPFKPDYYKASIYATAESAVKEALKKGPEVERIEIETKKK